MATAVNTAETRAVVRGGFPWLGVAWFLILIIAAYFPVLKLLTWQWANDEDVGHGFLVPLVAGYIAWQRRDRLAAIELKPAWWGLALLAWGGLQAWIGLLG